MHPSALTPLIASISGLVILGLYAIIETVSNAAFERFGFALLSITGCSERLRTILTGG